MESALFFIFAILATVSGILVVVQSKPVHSVIFLIINFFCLAVLYLLLNAQFIAAVQIIVYAGAIMTLFLFVVMLLNLDLEDRAKKMHLTQKLLGIVLGLFFFFNIGILIQGNQFHFKKGIHTIEKIHAAGNTASIAEALFTDYLLPFEAASILLLVAIVGAIVLAKGSQVTNKRKNQ